jgi:hypothetical protein
VGPLDGDWRGIIGGTNIGKVSAKFQQHGDQVSGQFTFLDLVIVPVEADFSGVTGGRWLDGGLQRIRPTQPTPPGANLPSTGRVLGVIEENGRKISGFWMTNIGTGGGFVILRET